MGKPVIMSNLCPISHRLATIARTYF